MGWWEETTKGHKAILGDEPLDLVLEALAGFSRAYEEDLDRKPTLEEFRLTLLQALGGDPARYFAGLEANVVGELSFRLKKVPRRQGFAVGDYFAIPLDGRFWYGRIIYRGAGDHLVEVYTLQSDQLLSVQRLLDRKPKVALYKHVFSLPAFTRGRWKIIGHQDIPKDFQYPSFYGGMMADGSYTIWRGDARGYELRKKAMRYEPLSVFAPERIEKALRDRQFDRWPEIEASKKDTFGRHDQELKFMHEYFGFGQKKKN